MWSWLLSPALFGPGRCEPLKRREAETRNRGPRGTPVGPGFRWSKFWPGQAARRNCLQAPRLAVDRSVLGFRSWLHPGVHGRLRSGLISTTMGRTGSRILTALYSLKASCRLWIFRLGSHRFLKRVGDCGLCQEVFWQHCVEW